MRIVFATNNLHKFREIKELIGGGVQLLNLRDIGCRSDIPEPYSTIEENACAKAAYIWNNYGYSCFSDDTALEVGVLNGNPGVFSARYAQVTTGAVYGTSEENNEANIKKLLTDLEGFENRKARFRTVICLIINGKEVKFEGVVNGSIIDEKRGNEGFGYDPVFMPEGYDRTFAQMNLNEKNQISHRAQAFKKLAEYIRNEGT